MITAKNSQLTTTTFDQECHHNCFQGWFLLIRYKTGIAPPEVCRLLTTSDQELIFTTDTRRVRIRYGLCILILQAFPVEFVWATPTLKIYKINTINNFFLRQNDHPINTITIKYLTLYLAVINSLKIISIDLPLLFANQADIIFRKESN